MDRLRHRDRSRLIAAIVWNADGALAPWPSDEALPVFNDELQFWFAMAELL